MKSQRSETRRVIRAGSEPKFKNDGKTHVGVNQHPPFKPGLYGMPRVEADMSERKRKTNRLKFGQKAKLKRRKLNK